MSVIQKERIQAYFDEFPWLKEYLVQEGMESVKVSRIDLKLLEAKPDFEMNEGRKYHLEHIWLIDREGQKLAEVGKVPRPSHINWFQWFFIESEGNMMVVDETIGDALIRLGDECQKVHFILDFSLLGRSVIIHKSPKQFNMRDWLQHLRNVSKNAVNQQIAEVDKEVEKVKKLIAEKTAAPVLV